ncbi:hypothetical protein PQX77_001297 [Marasmius sp. AFHP31]|nr:hypothetical protein PQX77_001297 [Marasmius sp. AFHP31]
MTGLSGELELDVYIISLSRIGLDDCGSNSLINELPEQRVALMEDIDAAFTHGLTREPDEEENLRLCDKEDEKKEKDKRNEEAKTVTSHQVGEFSFFVRAGGRDWMLKLAFPSSSVSFSGPPSTLSTVSAPKKVVFCSPRRTSTLHWPPALCRPGRMDLHIEFNSLVPGQGAVQAVLQL